MIRAIDVDSVEESGALELVWRVFEEFEAPEYSDEGVQEFKNFIAIDTIKHNLNNAKLFLWGYFSSDKIVGVIATRSPCHISLLFVDKEYHRRGIARSLCRTVIDFYKKSGTYNEITVNSSPYAAEAYHRLGFVDTNTEQIVNGIRFIPMKKSFR